MVLLLDGFDPGRSRVGVPGLVHQVCIAFRSMISDH